MKSYSESYKESGVDITAGYKAVELMKKHIARTTNARCLSGIGGFGGLFEPDLTGIANPVFVSGTDGVGTKLKIAFLTGLHNTVGIDCVAMCVNDIICAGAKPLVFLDYIATGKNIPEKIASIVEGVAEAACRRAVCLSGGETAEMPGFYPEDEYDLAGFSFGVVDKAKELVGGRTRRRVRATCLHRHLPSCGVHSNGFSLVRKVFGMEFGGALSRSRYVSLSSGRKHAGRGPADADAASMSKPVLALLGESKRSGRSRISPAAVSMKISRAPYARAFPRRLRKQRSNPRPYLK